MGRPLPALAPPLFAASISPRQHCARPPPASAFAQAWPSKQPIRIIVPVTAGSALDITARVIGDQPPGSSARPSWSRAAPAPAARSVPLSSPSPTPTATPSSCIPPAVTIFPATFANLPFDTARDFAAVAPAVNAPLVLVVSPSKHKSLKDLVAPPRRNPAPSTTPPSARAPPPI